MKKFSTIEQVKYCLQNTWPIADASRLRALRQVQAAMDCVVPVGVARRAFVAAARSAGLTADIIDVYQTRLPA